MFHGSATLIGNAFFLRFSFALWVNNLRECPNHGIHIYDIVLIFIRTQSMALRTFLIGPYTRLDIFLPFLLLLPGTSQPSLKA